MAEKPIEVVEPAQHPGVDVAPAPVPADPKTVVAGFAALKLMGDGSIQYDVRGIYPYAVPTLLREFAEIQENGIVKKR